MLLANNIGDGFGVTTEQAAAVTNSKFAGIFTNNTTLTHFDEFEYFTNITDLGNFAFEGANSLISVSLPDSLSSGGSRTFYGCRSLTTLTLNSSVNFYGNSMFVSCANLTKINIPNLQTWCNCRFSSAGSQHHPGGESKNLHLYINSVEITSISNDMLPGSITSFGDYVFAYCKSLTSVAIPNTIQSLGSNLFKDCVSLSVIDIPNSVTSIGTDCFDGCSSIVNMVIPSSVQTYSNTSRSCFSSSTGNGTGILDIQSTSTFYRTSNSSIDGFRHIRFAGNVEKEQGPAAWIHSVNVVSFRVIGNFTDTTTDNYGINYTYNNGNSKLAFVEVMGTITITKEGKGIFGDNSAKQQANGAILHLGYNGIACSPIQAGADLSRVYTIYVGDGSSAAADQAVLDIYLADPSWQAYSSKLAKWSDYDGEYKTFPTIPTE